MGYGDAAARIRDAAEKLIMRRSPGASEDARAIAKEQGAKTNKQVEAKAKVIAQNRINDAAKNTTRAGMQNPNFKLGKRFVETGTQKGHTVTKVDRKTGKSK